MEANEIKRLKLTAGLLLSAWKAYPEDRRRIACFPAGKPIFLTGAHRSGTTWAAAMLAEPGLWYVHEPFNPNKGFWHEAFTYVDPESTDRQVNEYLEALVHGRYRRTSSNGNAGHPLMPLRLFRQPIQRVLIKDPIACLLTGYIARHFDFDIIVLMRHPAGFASSVTRLGWPVSDFLKQILRNEQLMSEHLNPYADQIEKYQHRDDLEAAAVLHGVLNRVLWGQCEQNRNINLICFEELCQAPLERFEELFGRLGLPFTHGTRLRHSKLCCTDCSPNEVYRTHEVKRNSLRTSLSWKTHLTVRQLLPVRRIWDQFEIPLYRADVDWSTRDTQEEKPG